MLVLTRKVGDGITIGDRIRVKIVEIKGTQIRLGIEAPADFRIYRDEIYEKVLHQNQLAAAWDLGDFRKAVNLFTDAAKERQP